MAHPLLTTEQGCVRLLLGNEAIVRGALEAGVDCVACYPGTPSSEAPDTFFRIQAAVQKAGGESTYHFEYSPNEKVALEVGGGATLAGAMTLVTMKHVGVNVAADPLFTMAYTGTPGGLVLLSADDPGCHSSQNEQDNRQYARSAFLPCFEPADAQECKDMAREALRMSRRIGRPVLLRTTTRVNHIRGPVTFGHLPGPARQDDPKPFVKAPARYVPVPVFARRMRLELLDFMTAMAEEAEDSPWNVASGEGDVGVIASGIARAYLRDALQDAALKDNLAVLELGFTYPLPERRLQAFMERHRRLVVLEEGEPVLERELRELAQRLELSVEIVGKLDHAADAAFVRVGVSGLPRFGEYETATVRAALAKALEMDHVAPAPHPAAVEAAADNLPLRPPNLCAGCSHRSLYYAVREEFGDDAVYSSDIGCYTLGLQPPLNAADFLFCMGSSVSSGCGMARFDPRPVLAFIGDSTFFHSGVTGLINAVFNNHNLIVVVLDNRTTAMTGHQPHPGVDETIVGPNESKVDIEALCRAVGVEHMRTVNPNKLSACLTALRDLRQQSGVRVLIAREPCVLYARRALGQKPAVTAEVAAQGGAVDACVEKLACPAFYRDAADAAGESGDHAVRVDETLCTGCMVCGQVVKEAAASADDGAIKARKRG